MQTDTDKIRYRADGSIDTGHYMQIGRRMRSEQAHKMAKSLTGEPNHQRRMMFW